MNLLESNYRIKEELIISLISLLINKKLKIFDNISDKKYFELI